MKEFLMTITVAAALALCVNGMTCSTKAAQRVDGKVLKDAEGNYYQVEANVGDTVFVRKLDIGKFEKF